MKTMKTESKRKGKERKREDSGRILGDFDSLVLRKLLV